MSAVSESTSWPGVGGAAVAVRLSRTHGEVACGIFHIPTTEVELAGGEARWGAYDAAQLCCGHTFNVCALALHFLINAMTCPVCRAGTQEAMCLATVPASVQQLFAETIQPEAVVLDGISLDFDRNDIASEVRLHVVHWSAASRNRPVRFTTPLRALSGTGRAAHMQPHGTHRTFQRYFNTLMHSAGADAVIRLAIHHPLLDAPLRSAFVSVRAFAAHGQLEVEDDTAIAYTEHVDGLTRLIVEVHIEYLIDVIVHGVLQRIVEGQ
jgi:hypothetical protein